MARPRIVFFHGLNTYGDDLLHVGPLTFGPMHAKLEQAFSSRGFDFVPIENLHATPPEIQANEVAQRFERFGHPDPVPIHVLGHSTGGLTARAFAHQPSVRDRIRSVVTIGTPHRGALPAEFALGFDASYPVAYRLFKTCGYDTKRKLAIFESYTRAAAEAFNALHPDRAGVRYACAINEVPVDALSLPLKPMYRWFHSERDTGRSDGFILTESQRWGEQLGSFALDHFGGLGYCFQATKQQRRAAHEQFEAMVESITKFCRGV